MSTLMWSFKMRDFDTSLFRLQTELDDVPRGPEIFSSHLLEIEQLNKIKQEIDQVGKHDILYLASVYCICSYS